MGHDRPPTRVTPIAERSQDISDGPLSVSSCSDAEGGVPAVPELRLATPAEVTGASHSVMRGMAALVTRVAPTARFADAVIG